MIDACRIRVTGVVQGVGFRPFVWRLARELELTGWVRNDASGVEIAAEGAAPRLQSLLERLRDEAPPLARIDAVRAWPERPQGARDFLITESRAGRNSTGIGHDTGLCRDCLEELFDPGRRRWRHAFITCTHCGPRLTLTRAMPYDRANTALAPYPLCRECAAEYGDPADRRFHAETTCCPACGPQLALLGADGARLGGDPIERTLCLLRAGSIVAIKGLGGFHLACDARNALAVARLRSRKHREEKPFAVMAANAASLRHFARIDEAEQRLLESPERPIVLCAKATSDLEGVAPGLAALGAMLPATPMQFLLFHEAAGRPHGTGWLRQPQGLLLVMTSANPGGEPLVTGNDEARQRLAGIADAILEHDRDIVVRCDDSVRTSSGFVRRARGYVPQAIRLPRAGPEVLALGGSLKNTVCVSRGREAFVSQHVGDLDTAPACRFLGETVEHLLAILDVRPERIACDLHPDFHSTRFAHEFAARRGIALIAVQHHHAHIAAVLAEHGVQTPALGLALDGVGLGTDGGLWGGELLRVEGAACERLAHLAPMPLPGGDRAAREPWRMAAAALFQLGRGEEIERRFADQAGAAAIHSMLERGINTPPTSSLGRVFDAAVGLLGLRRVAAYEGQAAMELEALAGARGPRAPVFQGWRIGPDGNLDLLPLLGRLADEPDPALGAALFHETLACALGEWAGRAARRSGLGLVAAGGGCLLNRRLSRRLREQLERQGLELLEARELPPNDGGLSLGQAWVALHAPEP